MNLVPTASQTVGPYFSIGMAELCSNRVPHLEDGELIEIEGRIVDGDCLPIPDAVLEVWSADVHGRYLTAHADEYLLSATEVPGFARVSTSADGRFHFSVVKPGRVRYDADRLQESHLIVLIFMRGLLRNLVTRMYFPDKTANVADPILQLIPENRRHTLIAKQKNVASLEWNIVVRGEEETVFFVW